MRKCLACLACFAILFSGKLLAQNRSVIGTVIDEKGVPIAGASVTVPGTKIGATTNTEGSFTLSLPSNARTITISAIDRAEKTVSIASISSITVSLGKTERNLQEVVIVGYGTRRKRDEAGAIASIRSKDLESLPLLSADKALQGLAPGVLVQANNGIPGGGININIRGIGSINGNTQPLYIIDGVQMNTSSTGSNTQNNPLAAINPADIESLDVLKDAASASIYGSSAANGVVIITTKKGKTGKTKFTANISTGFVKPLKKFDVLNAQQYHALRSEARANQANIAITDAVKQTVLNEMGLSNLSGFGGKSLDSAIGSIPTVNWQDAIFQTGKITSATLSAAGGADKTTFYLSASYDKSEAIARKVDFTRGVLNFKLSNKVTDKLSFNTSVNLSSFYQSAPFATDGNFLGSPLFSGSLMLPSNQIYNKDGSYTGDPSTGALAGILGQNIVAVTDYNTAFNRTNQLIGNISAEYKIADWLTFRSSYTLDYRDVEGKLIRDSRTPDGFGVKGSLFFQTDKNTLFTTTQLLLFNKLFNDIHRIDGVAGLEYINEKRVAITGNAQGVPTPYFTVLGAAINPVTIGEFESRNRNNGAFASANYTYSSKYSVGVSFRYDGSSVFGINNQFALFPSVKAVWNVDKESFMTKANFISQLRLRASLGNVGNRRFLAGDYISKGLYFAGAQYNGQAGLLRGSYANPDLKWESVRELNLGVDVGVLDNRILLTLDYYNKKTNDVVLFLPTQQTSGLPGYFANVGKIRNRGIELGLTATVIKTTDFNWLTTFNFASNENKIVELYGNNKFLPSDPSVAVGRSYFSAYTIPYAGVNPATGRPQWYDTLGNLTYTPITARDRRYIGDQIADFTGGFKNTITYKNFTLDFLLAYEYGRLSFDGQVTFLNENGNRQFNGLKDNYDNRWTAPGQITSVPRAYNGGAEPGGLNHVSASSRNWRRADFIRLRNVVLSYDVNAAVLKQLKISNCKFYVQGTNLWTYDDWWGYDPEFGGPNAPANGIVPQSKNISFGLQLGF
jgi:TonB-dependent starch-binding outer membrane protein SusC